MDEITIENKTTDSTESEEKTTGRKRRVVTQERNDGQPKKKPGPKPKALQEQKEIANEKPLNYDYVIKVLDDAKKKIERKKAKSGMKEKKETKFDTSFLSLLIPGIFLLILSIKIIFLFVS